MQFVSSEVEDVAKLSYNPSPDFTGYRLLWRYLLRHWAETTLGRLSEGRLESRLEFRGGEDTGGRRPPTEGLIVTPSCRWDFCHYSNHLVAFPKTSDTYIRRRMVSTAEIRAVDDATQRSES